jgi:hypothetical protein
MIGQEAMVFLGGYWETKTEREGPRGNHGLHEEQDGSKDGWKDAPQRKVLPRSLKESAFTIVLNRTQSDIFMTNPRIPVFRCLFLDALGSNLKGIINDILSTQGRLPKFS